MAIDLLPISTCGSAPCTLVQLSLAEMGHLAFMGTEQLPQKQTHGTDCAFHTPDASLPVVLCRLVSFLGTWPRSALTHQQEGPTTLAQLSTEQHACCVPPREVKYWLAPPSLFAYVLHVHTFC